MSRGSTRPVHVDHTSVGKRGGRAAFLSRSGDTLGVHRLLRGKGLRAIVYGIPSPEHWTWKVRNDAATGLCPRLRVWRRYDQDSPLTPGWQVS